MDREELNKVLEDHREWLADNSKGKRADLSEADLRWADLRWADLRWADLRQANLCQANLRGADLREANLREADLRWADLRQANLCEADLRGADLREANLREANLREADLRWADLCEADLREANLRGANLRQANLPFTRIPTIKGLHAKILEAINAPGCKLDMCSWHRCDTTHCRAGWAIHLAGDAGYLLEDLLGPSLAGALITLASCQALEKVPDFCASNKEALADIKRLAEAGM